MRRSLALAAGLACHGTFLAAIGWMVASLYTGLRLGVGRLHGSAGWIANAFLVLQFPLAHSLLLTGPGRKQLERLAPSGLGRALAPTSFATVAAVQLLATFALWSPSGIVWVRPTGLAAALSCLAYAASWVFLVAALRDGGLGLQTGWIGWTAVWAGRAPRYGSFPTHGTFRFCRQPIYLAFAATLWTGPVWTPDRLLLASAWTLYCLLAPLHKERRCVRIYGEAFEAYRARVPYILPRLPV